MRTTQINRPDVSKVSFRILSPFFRSDRLPREHQSCPVWRTQFVSQETPRRCLGGRLGGRSPSQLGLLVHIIHVLRVRVMVVIVIILFMARVASDSGGFLAVPLMLVPVGVVYRLRHQRLRHPRHPGVLLTPT